MRGSFRRSLAGVALLAACSHSHEPSEPRDASVEAYDNGQQENEGEAQGPDGRDTPQAVPVGSTHVRGDCGISLDGRGLVETDGASADYCIATFADDDCDYEVSFGAELDDALAHASAPDYTLEEVRVERDPAELASSRDRLRNGRYWVGLHVPSFELDPPGYSLNAIALCDSLEGRDSARAVLQTVDLPHAGEGLCGPVRPEKCTLLNYVHKASR